MRKKGFLIPTWGLALFLATIVCFSSCVRSVIPPRELSHCYVSNDPEGDVVLYFEDANNDLTYGQWYLDYDKAAEPHRFVATRGLFHSWRTIGLFSPFRATADHRGDVLYVTAWLDGRRYTREFHPVPETVMPKYEDRSLYRKSIFEVKCDKDIQYASALGYWESYPEPTDINDYGSIVLDKLNLDDMTKKELPLTMDVYYPDSDETTLRPLLMLIHGGAFFNGDKESEAYVKWGEYFASLGYVVASINYRIGFVPVARCNVDRAGYRAVQDAYAAMGYLLRHADQYQIDPECLFVGGTSAGGITALNLAFMRDKDRPRSTRGYILDFFDLLYDLGDIDAVDAVHQDPVSFQIKAVVNMWGAVHDVNMLENSPQTAILSFHGDADSVVAYGYDYPFTKISTPARDFVDSIASIVKVAAPDYTGLLNKAQNAVKTVLRPANQILCSPMYGSQCVDQRAKELGMHSELHTKAGGGHSLHVNDDGSLSDYYQLITDTMTQFLYNQIVPELEIREEFLNGKRWYQLVDSDELLTCSWKASGGMVLQSEFDRARVLFFADMPEHQLSVYGKLKNGKTYVETFTIKQ